MHTAGALKFAIPAGAFALELISSAIASLLREGKRRGQQVH
jgi:hypothetical protein